jgi:hypothetical protein
MEEEIHESVGIELPEELNDLQRPRVYNRASGYVDVPEAVAHNIDLCQRLGHVYEKPSQEMMDAISMVIFDTAEEENGTDYYVAYVLKDGKFEVSRGDYECGY